MANEVELYRLFRPTTFDEIIGQDSTVKVLRNKLKRKKLPHAIMFTGPSGVGKTTIARILRVQLDCSDVDFNEVNGANVRGIDAIRAIQEKISLAPLNGSSRVWLIDEAHKLTSDAQNSLLKTLEELPSHAYFFLATTEPGKLIKTVKNRCMPIPLKALSPTDIRKLVKEISTKAKIKSQFQDGVVNKLIEIAEGSARQAIVLLDKIKDLPSDEQLDVLEKADQSRLAIEICRALINPHTCWADMVEILKGVDEEPEALRRMMLGYASSCLTSKNTRIHARAFLIIQCARDNWFDCGRAGLVSCCYEVVNTKG